MQDLSPSEIEALSRAMGKSTPSHPPSLEGQHMSPYGAKGTPYDSSSSSPTSHAQFSQLQENSAAPKKPLSPEIFHDLPVQVEAILGRKKYALGELMKLHNGAVIPLDKLAGELIDIEANGKLIARGEVVVVDENYGIKITEILDH